MTIHPRLPDLVKRPAWRTRGGWKPKGRAVIQKKTADKLCRDGLAARTTLGGHPALVLTDAGRAALGLPPAPQRAEAPAAARLWWTETEPAE